MYRDKWRIDESLISVRNDSSSLEIVNSIENILRAAENKCKEAQKLMGKVFANSGLSCGEHEVDEALEALLKAYKKCEKASAELKKLHS